MSIYIKPHHIEKFKPTWLMIKVHNKTGLKYFCKTTRKDPLKYKGSGPHWVNHLIENGKDITTTWCHLFTDIHKLVEYATDFSNKNNIVESSEWANRIPENGLGSVVGQPGTPHTPESRKKISENNANKGKSRTPETIKKIQESWNKRTGVDGYVHHLTGKISNKKDKSGHIFTEEQKQKISQNRKGIPSPFKGIPRSDEVKRKISKSHKARQS